MSFKNQTNQNGTASKTVLSIRCLPEFKCQLSEKAKVSGITLSEYSEKILNNDQKINDENKKLKMEISNLSSKLLNNATQMEILKNNYQKKIIELNNINEQLQNENKSLKKLTEIFDHPNSESLFNKAKGKRYLFNKSDGNKHYICYESKVDIVESMNKQTNNPQREINYGNIFLVGLLVLTMLAIIVKMKEPKY
jgi:hypothetical protein